MKKIFVCTWLAIILIGCRKDYEAPVPDLGWDLFNMPQATLLTSTARLAMEGVYAVTAGNEKFGDQFVLKTSHVVTGSDTVYHLSLFGEKDIPWMILEGKRLGDSILLNGFWRKMVNTETGKMQLVIASTEGALRLFQTVPLIGNDSIIIHGKFANGSQAPQYEIKLQYRRPVNQAPFEILAHRAGGRTADLLPHSENSVAMIRFASRIGATGIEIDTRLTSDGVPILYHDNTLNLRLIQKNGLVGPISAYTYDQLLRHVHLINGERIPTVREALNTIVYETGLRYVWLDTKFEGSLEPIRQLQAEFLQLAAQAGRQLEIVIGIPSEEALEQFKQLPNYTSVPSLCELTLADVAMIQAKVWAPRWTLGLQEAEVAQVHAAGRKVFVWTLDVPGYAQQFINDGDFDGILSNYPSLIAYYHYAKQ